MSTIDWMTQLSRLNFFAGQLAARQHVAADDACDSIRQLANVLESMVHSGDVYLSAASPAASSIHASPPYNVLPMPFDTDEAAYAAGSSFYNESDPLPTRPTASASPTDGHVSTDLIFSRASHNQVHFAEPYTLYAPPPDTVARNIHSTDHVVVLRDLSAPSDASASSRPKGINPCLPVRFRGFVPMEIPVAAEDTASDTGTPTSTSCLPRSAFAFATPYTVFAPPPDTVARNIHSSDHVVVLRDLSTPRQASAGQRPMRINPCLPVRFSDFVPWGFTTASVDTASGIGTLTPPPPQPRYALRIRG